MRSAPASNVKVDERTFDDLAAFATRFGALVDFYGLDDRPDGDWSGFFLSDPALIQSSIKALDLDEVERRFWALLKALRDLGSTEGEGGALGEFGERVVTLAGQIDGWLKGARMNPHSRATRLFARSVGGTVEASLRGHVANLLGIVRENLGSGQAYESMRREASRLSPSWRVAEGASNPSPRSDASDLLDELERIAKEFALALRQVRDHADGTLSDAATESDHRPQAALYAAFVRLFAYAQDTLNRTAERLKRFYYRDLLRERPAGPSPDRVYLTLSRDPASASGTVSVPAGTGFAAGQEADGTPIVYASDATLSVTAAALVAIRAVRRVSGPLYFSELPVPALPSPPEALQRILISNVDLKTMNDEAAGKGPATGLLRWPAFGEVEARSDAIVETEALSAGFVIASNTLMLAGGDRQFTVGLVGQRSHHRLLADLKRIVDATGAPLEDVVSQALGEAFDFWVTTADGWLPISPDLSDLSSDPPGIEYQFSLPPNAPPLVAFATQDGQTPPESPAPGLPALKASLNVDPILFVGLLGAVRVYPLSLFASVEVERVEITASTTGMPLLDVATPAGAVDVSQPFPVFGGLPTFGSYLQFRQEELFVKNLVSGSLSIGIDWYGLPADRTGFEGYYRDYVLGPDGNVAPVRLFDNQTFLGKIQVVAPGQWDFPATRLPHSPSIEEPSGVEVYLFQTVCSPPDPVPAPNGTLCPTSVFSRLPIESLSPPAYYDPAASAIRLTLEWPPYAFGNALYAPNVTRAVVDAMPWCVWTPEACPDCLPLADVANTLEAIVESEPLPASGAIADTALECQARLLRAAEELLATNLTRREATRAEWVAQTFSAPGDVPTRARQVAERLQTARRSLDSGSTPGLGTEDAEDLSRAFALIEAIFWIGEAIDGLPFPARLDAYEVEVRRLFGACARRLRGAYAECIESRKLRFPNPPWLPQAQGITLGYTARCHFSPAVPGAEGGFFRLGNFADPPPYGTPVSLLGLPEASSLELGFSGLEPAQALGLLVQTDGGTDAAPPAPIWQRREPEGWVAFEKAQIPLDTTNGLQNVGVLKLNVPQAEVNRADMLNLNVPPVEANLSEGPRWIRAVTSTPEAFPNLIGIYPHVLAATWQEGVGGSGEHLGKPLPPYTIQASVQPLGAIQTIDQPMESIGGRPAENEESFRARLAERLRHKGRAILPWDYEQLVLEAFPSLWQAKALSATDVRGDRTPGLVSIVVVAGPNGASVPDPTEPLASAEMLAQIQVLLASVASPFATIHVSNPDYVRIKVIAEVAFQGFGEAGGGIDALNADLVAYLSPWFYDDHRAADRGRDVEEDEIRDFIQSRPYTDALIDVRFEYDPAPESLGWFFLTSAKRHSISEASYGESATLPPEDSQEEEPSGPSATQVEPNGSSDVADRYRGIWEF